MGASAYESDRPFLTTGDIAKYLGLRQSTVDYVVMSKRIDPTLVAGRTRAFSRESAQLIVAECRRLMERRETRRKTPAAAE